MISSEQSAPGFYYNVSVEHTFDHDCTEKTGSQAAPLPNLNHRSIALLKLNLQRAGKLADRIHAGRIAVLFFSSSIMLTHAIKVVAMLAVPTITALAPHKHECRRVLAGHYAAIPSRAH